MSNPDDVRAMFRILLNQIPDTMTVTHSALELFASLESVRPKGAVEDIDIEALHQLVAKLQSTTCISLIELENRVERLSGRDGISDDLLGAVMSEFRTG